ncbi:Diol dehydratase-reactivating factor alpha subunit [Klebsiella variicola]|nr:Diol dehydratase-reactivating factor alpha subunit [Klebsiella variicola]
MRYIAGIDIGNSSTEVALATVDDAGVLNIRHSALAETTGIKGTLRNVFGIQEALTQAAKAAGIQVSDISLIRINEATPVIGDVAMDTITETIITESTMIGHNPKTPGGVGLGVGITITPEALLSCAADAPIFWWSPQPLTLPMSLRWSMRRRQRAIRFPALFCSRMMACWSITGYSNRCR